MKKIHFLFVIYFICYLGNSQTDKDIILTKTIPELLLENNEEAYHVAKKLLQDLESEYGPLPEHKFQFLSSSYTTGDLAFFKTELISLVENFGLDLIFLDKRISYYKAITTGELSNWFRDVYPNSRAIWLVNNFEKIPYLKELNDFYVKDQTLASLANAIRSDITLENDAKEKINSLVLQESKSLFSDLLALYENIGAYPSAKSFSLPQSPYFLVETHVLKIPSISFDYLKKIYPYYESAYLNNEIDYQVFRDFDAQLLFSTGSQYFGTINEKEVPDTFLNENGKAPNVDESTLEDRRRKLKWD